MIALRPSIRLGLAGAFAVLVACTADPPARAPASQAPSVGAELTRLGAQVDDLGLDPSARTAAAERYVIVAGDALAGRRGPIVHPELVWVGLGKTLATEALLAKQRGRERVLHRKAAAAYLEVSQIAPGSSWAFPSLVSAGDESFFGEDWPSARDAYSAALEALSADDPLRGYVLDRRGYLFLREGNDDEARAALDETIAFCKSHPGAKDLALIQADAERARASLP